MDQEVTRTLGELERKILELERTLNAMSDRAGSAPTDWSRIVDEKVERRQTAPLPPPPAPLPLSQLPTQPLVPPRPDEMLR